MLIIIQTHIIIGFWVTVEIDGDRTQIKMLLYILIIVQ